MIYAFLFVFLLFQVIFIDPFFISIIYEPNFIAPLLFIISLSKKRSFLISYAVGILQGLFSFNALILSFSYGFLSLFFQSFIKKYVILNYFSVSILFLIYDILFKFLLLIFHFLVFDYFDFNLYYFVLSLFIDFVIYLFIFFTFGKLYLDES